MRVFRFTIYGNQEDPTGNPIPYYRQTQGSKWSVGAKRYQKWKEYVQTAFCRAHDAKRTGKPFQETVRGVVSAEIYFSKENHGDSDNIIKGLLDSLFKNDKEMDVVTNHTCGNRSGRVDVTVQLYDED